jgi:nicotianamine synthase
VCHPDDDVVNSVIIARKSNDDVHADGLQNARGQHARRTVPVVSPPCRFGEMVADVTHKMEDFAKAEVAF